MPRQRYEISDADKERVAGLFNTPRLTGRSRADGSTEAQRYFLGALLRRDLA